MFQSIFGLHDLPLMLSKATDQFNELKAKVETLERKLESLLNPVAEVTANTEPAEVTANTEPEEAHNGD